MESKGYKVDRQFRIGQREVYLPEIEEGSIDLFPEYTGNLLQYWKPDAEARLADEVYAELQTVTPEGLRVLDQSEASDQDSYTVTKEYADKWGAGFDRRSRKSNRFHYPGWECRAGISSLRSRWTQR